MLRRGFPLVSIHTVLTSHLVCPHSYTFSRCLDKFQLSSLLPHQGMVLGWDKRHTENVHRTEDMYSLAVAKVPFSGHWHPVLHSALCQTNGLFVFNFPLIRKNPGVPRGCPSSHPHWGLHICSLPPYTCLLRYQQLRPSCLSCMLSISNIPHRNKPYFSPFSSPINMSVMRAGWLWATHFAFLSLPLLVPEPVMKTATRALRGTK